MTEHIHRYSHFVGHIYDWFYMQGAHSFATIGLIIALCHFMPRLFRWLYKAYSPASMRASLEQFRDISPFVYRLLFVALPGNMPLFLWVWLHRTESLPMDFGLLISHILPSLLLFTVLPAILLDIARASLTKILFHVRFQDPLAKKLVRCLAYVISPCDMTEITGPKIVDSEREHPREKPTIEKYETSIRRTTETRPAES